MNPSSDLPKFAHWALIELMGHQTAVGLVTEETIAGKTFLRVEIPNEKCETVCTRYYAPDAVYCISPISKQIALGLAARYAVRPATIYDLQKLISDKKVGEGDENFLPND